MFCYEFSLYYLNITEKRRSPTKRCEAIKLFTYGVNIISDRDGGVGGGRFDVSVTHAQNESRACDPLTLTSHIDTPLVICYSRLKMFQLFQIETRVKF